MLAGGVSDGRMQTIPKIPELDVGCDVSDAGSMLFDSQFGGER